MRPADRLTVALPKGRLAGLALGLLARAGFAVPELPPDSRKLEFDAPDGRLRFILVKPADVPIYVEYGVADLGIAGKDTIVESCADVYDVLDLKVGKCRMVVAGPSRETAPASRAFMRVATKYPHVAERHFLEKGLSVEIVGLTGSVELAPVTGLAECIVDLVETGSTLAAHDLVELEVLFHSSARLVVNRASHKLRYEVLAPLVERLREVVA